MSGQLGDMPPPAMASPKKQPPAPSPAPSSTPAPAAVDSKPVVEAADQTPPAPETKVVPATIPTPDTALNSPDHDAPPPDCTPQETPQSKEQKQPPAAEPVSEPIIHPEQDAPISESVAESIPATPAVEQQQNSSEKIVEGHPHPETEPSDADQQTQSATVSEIPAVEQQQSSSEKAAEDHPHSETEPSNVEQQAQSAPVSEIPAVQQQQSSSENVTEDLSLPVESETQNLLTNTGLDKTTVPAEVETEPNPKITQSEAAAPPTDNEKVEPTPEKLPEETTNSIEPKPVLIPEAVSEEVPVQLDSKPDSIATNVKEEKLTEVELDKPSEKPQVDEPQATAAGQTPTDTVDIALNVGQTDITTKPEDDSVAPDVKNEVTAEIKVETEPITEKPVFSDGAAPPPVEVIENVAPEAPVDNVEVPKPDETKQEIKPEPVNGVEPESSSVVSENKHPVSASEEESQTNKVENKPTEKEEEPAPLDPADTSPPVAPVEGETNALEKAKEEITVENKVFENVIIEGETAKQKIPEKADEETAVEMKTIKDTAEEKMVEEKAVEKETAEEIANEKAGIENKSSNGKAFEEEGVQKNAAAERAIEVKADEGKAFEEEATEQKTVEKANDQKPQKEKFNGAESSPAASSNETENVCPMIEKKESETAREPDPIVTGEISKEEIQIHKEIEPGTKCEPSPAEERFVETVSSPEKSEEKEKPIVEAASVAQDEEKQTPIDTKLKADDKSEKAEVMSVPPTPESKEQDNVNVEESMQTVEMVLSSAVISETQVRDKPCEEKRIQDETEASSQKTNSIAENQHEIESETLALTGSDEKQLEKVTEHKVSLQEQEEKLDKKEVELQPVAGNIQEPISVSETNTVCDKDGTAQFDGEKNTISKTDEVFENGGMPVSVASVPVAEPEIPVFVVSEQDKGPKEENTNVEEKKEAKTQPLGKPSDEDAVDEVTIVFSISSSRLCDDLCTSFALFMLHLKMYWYMEVS